MAVRPIDANSLLDELTQIAHGMGRISIHISDMVKVMIRVVERQPTLTPPNEPLTLDELREMDGKPAYIPETNCWVLVTKNPFVPLFTWPDGEQCSAYDWYEQVSPVYRRPPEGET